MLETDYRGLLLTQEAEPPGSPQLIQEVETKLGHSLPDQYVDFLNLRNGGYLHRIVGDFIVDGEQLASPVRFFSVDYLLKSYKPDEWEVDPRLLPIAQSAYGDRFMIQVAGENTGKIFALAEYLLSFPGNRKVCWPALIADDFWDFVEVLRKGQQFVIKNG
ncbi:MAG: SMI1/KNR4 family protein [Litoreibacter sp.]